MAQRVLITGVGGGLGALIARRLDEDGALSFAGRPAGSPITLIGLDLGRPHRRWRKLKFIRADLRQTTVVDLIREVDPDIVLHFAASVFAGHTRPRQAHETNIIGTMNLLAGCRGAKRIVAESSAAVYPTSSDMPSVLREEDAGIRPARSRTAIDLLQMEAMLAEQSVANPSLEVTVLRFGTVLGPHWTGSLAGYLRQSDPPYVLGFDPRLQLLGIEDAVEATVRVAAGRHPGVFNVAGNGTVLLSWLRRLAGHSPRPLLPPLLGSFLQGQSYRLLTRHSPPPELIDLLRFGQVVDTTRLERELGWRPRHRTREVAAAFVTGTGSKRARRSA